MGQSNASIAHMLLYLLEQFMGVRVACFAASVDRLRFLEDLAGSQRRTLARCICLLCYMGRRHDDELSVRSASLPVFRFWQNVGYNTRKARQVGG